MIFRVSLNDNGYFFARTEHLKTFFSGLNPSSCMPQFCIRLVLVVCLLTPLVMRAESSNSLYKKGKDAEAAQKYESAYEFYKQAYDKSPKDLRFRTAFERTRFYAAAVKVHRGQLLRDGGRLEDALAEFEAAAAIDPSMDIAQQEIRETRRMLEQVKQQPPSSDNEPQSQGPLSTLLQQAQGPVELQPISDQPITLKLTEDSRMIYETIGKLAGINVLFDPDYTSRRIRIELNGVSLQDALEIVAFESKTFWRPVTSNTIFIAQDNPTKRKDLEQNVIKTFYLSNVSQTTDLQDIVNTMRSVLQFERIQQLASQNAIIVRGTPDQVALAEKLIDDIDKAKPEVVVDVAIMQVNRDKLRNLGITPPSSVTVQLQGVTTSAATNTNNNNNNNNNNNGNNNGTTTTTTPATNGLTFNDFKHIGSQSYAVTAPQATASFLFSDSDSRVIQNPQLRCVNGGKATLKIGDRVPVATGSFGNPFQASTTAGNFSGLVNTQFNYLDVGVNIEIQPTVHANREITLKMSLDISSVTSNVNIGGISQPVIGQRKIENEIRLKEGEINILGGIFEDSDIKSWSGIPGLGQIPLFRYLFATQSKHTVENEIVFVLIPHIVRMQEVTPLNKRSLDIGNGNTIELRRNAVKPPPPAQQPATSPPPGPAQPAVPQTQQQFVPPPQPQIPPPAVQPGGTPPQAAGAVAAPDTSTQGPGAMQPATANQVAAMQPGAGVQPIAGMPGVSTQAAQPPNAQPSATAAQPNSDAGVAPASPGAGSAAVRLDPPAITQASGTTAAINVMLDSPTPVHDFSMELKFDPTAMQLLNVTNGGYLSQDSQQATVVHRVNDGVLRASAIRPPGAPGVPGQGAVFTLVFLLNKPGDYVLTPTSVMTKTANGMLAVNPTAGPAAIKILAAPHR